MSATEPLELHLRGERLGALEDVGMGYAALDFAEEALLAHGAGSRILSLGLPLRWETVSGSVLHLLQIWSWGSRSHTADVEPHPES